MLQGARLCLRADLAVPSDKVLHLQHTPALAALA